MEVLKKLEGAYALLIKSTHYPGQLVACKRGSPLILGIKVGAAAAAAAGCMAATVSQHAVAQLWHSHWASAQGEAGGAC
jgi:glucosamine 6-phosphate synthetase-like amidotransferase/phosphosugar isomerase protein